MSPPSLLLLLKFRLELIPQVKRVLQSVLPHLSSEPSSSTRAHRANARSKSTPVCCVGASELHDICKFRLSFTKSICLVRFM